MNEMKILVRMAKRIRTPKDAILMLLLSAIFIVIVYVIPGDLLEDN